MTTLPGRARASMLRRSFAIQGSWNYETLIGTGFAFMLLPALRHLYGSDEAGLRAAVERHADLFNSHPYLATIAAGAVIRLESEGVDPQVVERFKTALRGSLGSIGDQLVWGAWRPMSLLLGIVLLLSGLAWWAALALTLAVYNALHLWLRNWALRAGLAGGLDVGRTLREAPLGKLASRASDLGALLAGAAVVLSLAPVLDRPVPLVAALLAVGAGLWLGTNARLTFTAAIAGLWLAAIIFGLTGYGA